MTQLSLPESSEAGEEQARSLLDQLLEDSRLYQHSNDYRELLEFAARFRAFAPFNAMLLDIQKPGMQYAASSADWQARFGRKIKEGARPLLILWPFAPVRLVYDLADTEGEPFPKDAEAFPARGPVNEKGVWDIAYKLSKKGVEWHTIDAGDAVAGSIRLVRAATKEAAGAYCLTVNRNHAPPVQFVTIAHELAHLFLGHLGPDVRLRITPRLGLEHDRRELEAESVAYLVAKRNDITPKSQTYLSPLLAENQEMPALDLYQVMRAAGQVEAFLGLKM